MFKAAKEFVVDGLVIAEGQEVKNPTQRMKGLGLVVEVQDAPAQEPKAVKPKKEKKDKAEQKVEEIQEVQEQILIEDSADVTVEKTEE